MLKTSRFGSVAAAVAVRLAVVNGTGRVSAFGTDGGWNRKWSAWPLSDATLGAVVSSALITFACVQVWLMNVALAGTLMTGPGVERRPDLGRAVAQEVVAEHRSRGRDRAGR